MEDEGVETDEDEGTESQIFSFEFNFYDTKIPNYQGPLELKATFEEAENIPAIIHLV
ncbi:hypothetical protein [Haladaptatus sp. R4]|uniref:hypothetical protein n=1 Tax=Haladaptatus sp. R4 TaxID=1679489 RepID=UPI0016805D5A|nr:hypothetical protein [Haladaptatus sp. R4]